jgi:hypothetical protein
MDTIKKKRKERITSLFRSTTDGANHYISLVAFFLIGVKKRRKEKKKA